MDYLLRDNRKISRLTVGTAQFGMNYGIANQNGMPTQRQVEKIVACAIENGVNCFDTAQAYGQSQERLGKALKSLNAESSVNVVTKLAPDLNPKDSRQVGDSIVMSVRKLCVERLWCLMLHRFEFLGDWDNGLGNAVRAAKENGVLEHFGVSVYNAEQAKQALEHEFVEVIQVPCSVWNDEMVVKGIFDIAAQKGKFCFVRSIYLQGLVLMTVSDVIKKLPIAGPAAEKWHQISKRTGIEVKELAMRFALGLDASLVVGVETAEQVKDNIKLFDRPPLPSEIHAVLKDELAPLLEEKITNPSFW